MIIERGSSLKQPTHLLTAAIPAAKLALRETLIRPCFVQRCLLFGVCTTLQTYSFTVASFVQYREQPEGAGIYVQLYTMYKVQFAKHPHCVKT